MDNITKSRRFKKIIGVITLGVLCLFLNAFLYRITGNNKIPLFLDTIGTMIATLLGGYIPGIAVAIGTNLIEQFFYEYAVYYCIVSVIIALLTCYFSRKGFFNSLARILGFIMTISVISSLMSIILTWLLYGYSLDPQYLYLDNFFRGTLNINPMVSFILSAIVVDILDKSISFFIAFSLVRALPEKLKSIFAFTAWYQTELPKEMNKVNNRLISLKTKIVLLLTFASLTFLFIATLVSILLFRRYTINQHSFLAEGVANLAASVIEPDMVNDYIAKGEDAEGYKDIKERLYNIRASSPDIEYVYVYQIREDGCYVVFDLDTDDVAGSLPGTKEEFDPSFAKYVDELLEGKKIEPIISNDKYGWLLTAYEPVFDSNGKCVCYAAADISMNDLTKYQTDFLVKLISIFLSTFCFILAIGLWLAKYHIVLPVNSMSYCANEFAYNSDEARESNVELIKNLDIHTGDEVENLYNAIMKTTEDSMNYVSDINNKTELISKLQEGLIMVLADTVENRDKSTGNHVRKTAAYTQIIMEELKELGYYTDILTDKYIYNVVSSAPLHDVGKIQIPDAILNKPGRLTDEEFEIMKTHTTAGEHIISQAIDNIPGADYLNEAKNIAAYHHEKWNGNGYPKGLVGEDIPLSARIMAVADVFDALVSKRVYKDAFNFEDAMEIIRKDAGMHFDPKVAEAFVKASDKVKEVSEYFDKLDKE